MVCIIPLEIVNIEEDGIHLYLWATINGKLARLLVDTGASRTVFDLGRIANLVGNIELKEVEKLSTGLGTNTMKSHTVILETIRIGQWSEKDYEAVVIDMSHVNQSYEMLSLPVIDGVLGGDLLMKLKAVIDYRKGVMKIVSRMTHG